MLTTLRSRVAALALTVKVVAGIAAFPVVLGAYRARRAWVDVATPSGLDGPAVRRRTEATLAVFAVYALLAVAYLAAAGA